MISRSSLGDALGGIRGVIDDLLAPYPFNRNISLKHPTGKTYILTEEQVEDLIDSIPSKFDDKKPSVKRTETEEEGVECISVHVGGKVANIRFIEDN